MTATLTTLSFDAEISTTSDVVAMATVVATALPTGVVEDRSGRSVGFAQDSIYRHLLHRPLLALERDRETVLEALLLLGPERGSRIASACATNADEVGASLFWGRVAEELVSAAENTVVAA